MMPSEPDRSFNIGANAACEARAQERKRRVGQSNLPPQVAARQRCALLAQVLEERAVFVVDDQVAFCERRLVHRQVGEHV